MGQKNPTTYGTSSYTNKVNDRNNFFKKSSSLINLLQKKPSICYAMKTEAFNGQFFYSFFFISSFLIPVMLWWLRETQCTQVCWVEVPIGFIKLTVSQKISSPATVLRVLMKYESSSLITKFELQLNINAESWAASLIQGVPLATEPGIS